MLLISVSNEQFNKNTYTTTFQVKSVYTFKIITNLLSLTQFFFDREFIAIIANVIMKH